jgi:rod shape-determining protein MreC
LPFALCVVGILLGVYQNSAKGATSFSGIESTRDVDSGSDLVSRLAQLLVRYPAMAMDGVGSWVADFTRGVTSANRLKRRTEALEAALQAYKADRSTIATLQRDLDEARKLAKLPTYPTFKKVAANVIGYFPEVRRLMLDVGDKRRVKPGAPVIGAGGLVGQVVEVTGGTCYVNLVTHADFSVGARVVSGETQEAGIATGQASEELLLSIYSETAKVNAGDLITTSGLSTVYPEGLAIGHITKVWQNKTLGIQEATLAPVVQAGQIRHVMVLVR